MTDTLSTFERVKLWNILGCKDAPEPFSEEWRTSLINQAERIDEEIKETVQAVQELDKLEVLDGICDIDVTVCGLFYLWGAESMPDVDENQFHDWDLSFNELSTVTLDVMSRYLQQFTRSVMDGDFDLAEQYLCIIGEELLFALECASKHFDYRGAINAVLDNNDSKYFTDQMEAIEHLNTYNTLAGETLYELCASVQEDSFDPNKEQLTAEDLDGAVFSIHRLQDDKIMKPIGFIGVDLEPYL